ncbi:ANTAR domain-containing protein [Streptomyces sp. NPDC005017]|uniref:ANTAR domain-containing protein n=1 Tax=Streptomyces sp. NPDC005017 TaxID=3364706 RepID=UPI0036B00C66
MTGGSVDVLCLSGILDSDGAAKLLPELAPYLERASVRERPLVLDLSDLRLVSAAGIRLLDLHTRHLDRRPVLVVAQAAHVLDMFALSSTPGLRVCSTLGAALAELEPALPADSGPADQSAAALGDLRSELFGLRAKARAGVVIGMAKGILYERYGLASAPKAFDLLRRASQQYNVPLRTVASAVVTAASPTTSKEPFSGSYDTAPPLPELLDCTAAQMRDRAFLLRAVAGEAVTLTDADATEVHLPDPALENHLVLEAHVGLDAAYRDCLAVVSSPPVLAARASARQGPVFVADITEDADLARSDQGQAALANGSRALYAVPGMDGTGECLGVICVHRRQPGSWMTHVQRTGLAALADDLAAWHTWYRQTIVADALEYLHACATHQM